MNTTKIYVLENIINKLNLYLSLIILIFGTTGNVLNCFVLSRRTLRTNPCARYFLFSSIVDIISISFGLITRIFASWQLDPTSTNNYLCKLRAFIVFTSRTMGIWLIMFASIDRWFLSSRKYHLRRLSNLKTVQSGIIFCFLISICSYIHMFFCYEANLIHTPLKCYGKNTLCCLVTDSIYALITILIPSIIMIVFSLMIIYNIHHLRKRIQNTTIFSIGIPLRKRDIRIRRTDYHLLRLLLVQALLLVIFCTPQAIQKFYITFQSIDSYDNWKTVFHSFLYNIEVLLAFMASAMPFYLYTLADRSIFRREFFALARTLYQKLICKRKLNLV
ncbi:hypothetical protein I4U23_001303 [Adineta vaga]|nr:hypothetical protein I4U23_001303 [Adineta vaga]